ncbi:MAG TPA: diacylglycerol kinase family protein [Candidatus Acidoferrales bacterium]|nr:diacylglycerol kinase family protein [Candidatus Acidoferrales bacterium]
MAKHFLAVVNPAAGGGRCGKFAPAALDRLRSAGFTIDVAQTRVSGHATELVREAMLLGQRNFLAVGGDGTSYEIVNGIFAAPDLGGERCTLAFLPLGTGNSFLRDFVNHRGAEDVDAVAKAMASGKTRHCDVIRLKHAAGEMHYINLLTLGFAADVADVTNRRFKRWGEIGYILGVLTCLARLDRRAFPLRKDGEGEFDKRRCLFVAFSNSKFTGGKMMIAPDADPCDGLIEYVRWGPIGRLGLLRNLHTLFDGTHVRHPLASRAGVRRVEFSLDEPVNVMIDGESLRLLCQSLEVLPGALDILI